MKKRLRFAIAGVATCAVFFGAGLITARASYQTNPSDVYVQQRVKILREASAREPSGEMVLIGDSISERSGIHRLCGRDVFNIGVSSAKLSDIERLALDTAVTVKPAGIYIAIGTNDAKENSTTDTEQWANQYTAMVRSFAPVPVTLIPAPVIEPGKKISAAFSEAKLQKLNARLPAIAAATGARLLPRPAIDTTDGVHQSRKGAADWRNLVGKGCA